MTYTTARRYLLEKAADLVEGDRNVQYGDPIDDFQRTANYWNIHILGVLKREMETEGIKFSDETDDILLILERLLKPQDVAILMSLLKISRLSWSPEKEDHWADLAGYAACGWDCVENANV